MKTAFGPNTPRILDFLMDLRNVSAAQIDRVASGWRQASDLDRAAAWARLRSAARPEREKYALLGAAYAARQAAMDAARAQGRDDWAFWAAAWDAGAAIIADGLADSDYELLTGPIAAVMPSLRGDRDITVPAQAPRSEGKRRTKRGSYR